MSIIKICIVACTLGIFATSCSNRDCNTTMANETAAPATATSLNDGTQAAATVPVDTPNQHNTDANSAERESTARTTNRSRTPGMNRPARENTSASAGSGNGSTPAEVDLKASKKREGNFTHGTGAENPGR